MANKKNKNDEKEAAEKIKSNVKKEVKDYVDDIKNNDVDFLDDKPFIQKFVFLLVGISNFVVGYALYFLIKDKKEYKWQSSYLVKGATIGLIICIIAFIFGIANELLEEIIYSIRA